MYVASLSVFVQVAMVMLVEAVYGRHHKRRCTWRRCLCSCRWQWSCLSKPSMVVITKGDVRGVAVCVRAGGNGHACRSRLWSSSQKAMYVASLSVFVQVAMVMLVE